MEDDPHYRTSLEQLFSQAEGFTLAGTFAAAPPVLADAERAMRQRPRRGWREPVGARVG